MSHENSETVTANGKHVLVYGQGATGGKPGDRIPGTPEFASLDEANTYARQRSESYREPPSLRSESKTEAAMGQLRYEQQQEKPTSYLDRVLNVLLPGRKQNPPQILKETPGEARDLVDPRYRERALQLKEANSLAAQADIRAYELEKSTHSDLTMALLRILEADSVAQERLFGDIARFAGKSQDEIIDLPGGEKFNIGAPRLNVHQFIDRMLPGGTDQAIQKLKARGWSDNAIATFFTLPAIALSVIFDPANIVAPPVGGAGRVVAKKAAEKAGLMTLERMQANRPGTVLSSQAGSQDLNAIRGAEAQRLEGDTRAVRRLNFNVEGTPFESAVKDLPYKAQVQVEKTKLYDLEKDPDKLRDALKNPDDINEYERAIQKEGYAGYIAEDNRAVLFGTHPVSKRFAKTQKTFTEIPFVSDRSEEIVNAFNESGGTGASFSMQRGDLGKANVDEWAVSLFPEREVIITGRDVNADDVRKFLQSNEDVLSDPRMSVGLWKDDASAVHLEPSYTTRSRPQAETLGRQFDQQGIFNLKSKEFVSTGGSGKPDLSQLPPLESRLGSPTEVGLVDEFPSATPLSSQFEIMAAPSVDALRQANQGVQLSPSMITNHLKIAGAAAIHRGAKSLVAFKKALIPDLPPSVANTMTEKKWQSLFEGSQKRYTQLLENKGVGDVPSIQRIQKMYDAHEYNKAWYNDWRPTIEEMFGTESYTLPSGVVTNDAEMFTRFFAAVSPRTPVEREGATAGLASNVERALHAFTEWKTGKPFSTDFEAHLQNLNRAAEGLPFSDTSPKVQSFFLNLWGDPYAVTIDGRMAHAFGFDASNIRAGKYQFMQEIIRQEARRAGVYPREYQAAIWTADKVLSEPGMLGHDVVASLKSEINRILDADPLAYPELHNWDQILRVANIRKPGFTTEPVSAVSAADEAVTKEIARLRGVAEEQVTAARRLTEADRRSQEVGVELERRRAERRAAESERGASSLSATLFLARAFVGATAGAMVGDEETRLRDALIGAGLGAFATPSLLSKLAKLAQAQKAVPEKTPFLGTAEGRRLTMTARLEKAQPLNQMALDYQRTLKEMQGDTRHWKDVLEESDLLANYGLISPEYLRALQPGKILNDAEIGAASIVMARSYTNLRSLADQYLRNPSNPNYEMEFVKQLVAHGMADIGRLGPGVTEPGRSLAMQKAIAPQTEYLNAVSDLISRLRAGQSTQRIAELLLRQPDPLAAAVAARVAAKPGFSDMIMEGWTLGLVSGLKTFAINILGNNFFLGLNIAERKGARLYGEAVAPGEAGAMINGILASYEQAAKASWQIMKNFETIHATNPELLAKYDIGQKAITAENVQDLYAMRKLGVHLFDDKNSPNTLGRAVDWLGTAIRFPARGLVGPDVFYRSIGLHAELYAQALREAHAEATVSGATGAAYSKAVETNYMKLLANPPDANLRAAKDFSQYTVFQKELGPFGQAIQQVAASTPAAKLVLPFVKTPGNIFKAGFAERTPLAVLTKDFRDAIKKGGADAELAMTRLAYGSMTMAFFTMLAGVGVITGSLPSNPAAKKIDQDNHILPGSVNISKLQRILTGTDDGSHLPQKDDQFIEIDRVDPLGIHMLMAADYARIAGDLPDADREELALALASVAAKTAASRTWVRGATEVAVGVSDPDKYAQKTLERFAGTFIPFSGFTQQLTREIDPTVRDAQGILDEYKKRVWPFSDSVIPNRDLFGYVVEYPPGVGPDVASPLPTHRYRGHPVLDALKVDDAAIAPIKEVFPVGDGRTIPLKPEEVDRYRVLAGHEIKDAMGRNYEQAMINVIKEAKDFGFTTGPDSWRAGKFQEVTQTFRAKARKQLVKEFPDLLKATKESQDDLKRAQGKPVINSQMLGVQ